MKEIGKVISEMVKVIVITLIYFIHLFPFVFLCLTAFDHSRRDLDLYWGSVVHWPHFYWFGFASLLFQEGKWTNVSDIRVFSSRTFVWFFGLARKTVWAETTVYEGENFEENVNWSIWVMSSIKQHQLFGAFEFLKEKLGMFMTDHLVWASC